MQRLVLRSMPQGAKLCMFCDKDDGGDLSLDSGWMDRGSSSTEARGEIDVLGRVFRRYRSAKDEDSDDVARNNDDRRVQEDDFNQEVYPFSFSELTRNDSSSNISSGSSSVSSKDSSISSCRGNGQVGVVTDNHAEELIVKTNSLSLEDVDYPLESIVIDYTCVPDVRKQAGKQAAIRRARRIMKEKERRKRLDMEREERERQVRAEEIERQRLIKMKEDWKRRNAELMKTRAGRDVLIRRKNRRYNKRDSLQVTLLKSRRREPWLRCRLSSFNC